MAAAGVAALGIMYESIFAKAWHGGEATAKSILRSMAKGSKRGIQKSHQAIAGVIIGGSLLGAFNVIHW